MLTFPHCSHDLNEHLKRVLTNTWSEHHANYTAIHLRILSGAELSPHNTAGISFKGQWVNILRVICRSPSLSKIDGSTLRWKIALNLVRHLRSAVLVAYAQRGSHHWNFTPITIRILVLFYSSRNFASNALEYRLFFTVASNWIQAKDT